MLQDCCVLVIEVLISTCNNVEVLIQLDLSAKEVPSETQSARVAFVLAHVYGYGGSVLCFQLHTAHGTGVCGRLHTFGRKLNAQIQQTLQKLLRLQAMLVGMRFGGIDFAPM